MKILNLPYPEKSDIKFTLQRFPDGQQNVVIHTTYEKIEYWRKHEPLGKEILITARLNNWLDLELISCAVASLRELGLEEIHLYTPYIIGARSDRKFEEGGNNYLRDVICPIINSLNFKTVTCIDPHSDVLEACIRGFRKEPNNRLLAYFFQDYDSNDEKEYIFVSPDAGASKKIYKLAEQIGYKGDIVTCSKDRDKDGKLTKTIVPNFDLSKEIIIIDDICDGGATFINIAKEIKNLCYNNPISVDGSRRDIYDPKIYLVVTHGIFSKGYKELLQYFDGIYTTNSYSDFRAVEDSDVKYLDRVNYLNVF